MGRDFVPGQIGGHQTSWKSTRSGFRDLGPCHNDYDSLAALGYARPILARCFFGCEHPFDACTNGVALSLPCSDFGGEAVGVVDPSVRALTAQDSDLDFDHVEQAGAWGVVELQSPQDAASIGGLEGLVEGAGRVD
jgi:hypothetical protein